MTLEQRKEFRRKVGMAILDIQNEERKAGVEVLDFLTEAISALMSFAALISCENAGLSKEHYLAAAMEAAEEQWPTKGEDDNVH